MRYHTAPIIAFAMYLEKVRAEHPNSEAVFSYGNRFSCDIKNMQVYKNSQIEKSSQYRSYELHFTFIDTGYEFRLDPGGSFFRHQPRGRVRFNSGRRYELERPGYQEKYVEASLSLPSGTFRGSYNNWHLERGEYSGKIKDKTVTMDVEGYHFRRAAYLHYTKDDRKTNWKFDIPISNVSYPRL